MNSPKSASTGLFLFVVLTAVVWVLTCSVANADPLTFQLSQDGWTGGGAVIGTFAGEDINKDGILSLADGEISSYKIELSGNLFIGGFTHTLSDLKFFKYTLGSSGFPPSFPLFSDNGSFFYDADDRIIGVSGFHPPFLETSSPAIVTPTAEPSTLILLSFGLAALIYRRRQNPSLRK